MRATDFEFRHRFWIIAFIFWLSFTWYSFDHVNAGIGLLRVLADPGLDFTSRHGRSLLRLIFLVASLFVSLGAMVRTWGSAYLRSDVVHDRHLHSERLVADGPYRHVRNPLYLGNVLMAMGVGLFASRTGWFILVLGMLLFICRLIGREETGLKEAQGEPYGRYLMTVPRLWPSLRPLLPSGGMAPQWKQAWLGESFMWAFTLASIGFAITLRLRVLYSLIVLSLIIRFGVVLSRKVGKSID